MLISANLFLRPDQIVTKHSIVSIIRLPKMRLTQVVPVESYTVQSYTQNHFWEMCIKMHTYYTICFIYDLMIFIIIII